MKITIKTLPPIQPPKTVTLELTETEACMLSSMVRCRGYTLKYRDFNDYSGPAFTCQELEVFSRAMADFQCQFPGPSRLVWDH